MASKVAIIGDGEAVLAFRAAGVDTYTATDAQIAKETLRKCAKKYKVILVSDVFCKELDDWLKRFLQEAYPVIVPVPTGEGSNGYAEEKMKEQMERALGVDILFGREDRS